MEKLIWVVWPSFLVAIVGEVAFFALINPQQLYFLGEPVAYSPLATYSIGFVFFWGLCAASSLLTRFMETPGSVVNAKSPKA